MASLLLKPARNRIDKFIYSGFLGNRNLRMIGVFARDGLWRRRLQLRTDRQTPAAQRKAASVRMKAYWAKRKKRIADK